MTEHFLEWLPDLLPIDPGQNWVQIQEYLYLIFKRTLIDDVPVLDGINILLKNCTLVNGKVKSFEHFITVESGSGAYKQRIPDMERCKRIHWVKAVLDHADDPRLVRWEQQRSEGPTIIIGLPDYSYLVMIGRRPGQGGCTLYFALTAYYVDRPRQREKYKKQHHQYILERRPQ